MASQILFILTCAFICLTALFCVLGSVASSYKGITVNAYVCSITIEYRVDNICYSNDCGSYFGNVFPEGCQDVCSIYDEHPEVKVTNPENLDFCDRRWSRVIIRVFAIVGIVLSIIGGALYLMIKFAMLSPMLRFGSYITLGLVSFFSFLGVIIYGAMNTFEMDFSPYNDLVSQPFFYGFYMIIFAGLTGLVSCVLTVLSLKQAAAD